MFQGPGAGYRDGFWAIPYYAHAEGKLGTYDSIGKEVVASDMYLSFFHGED